MAIAACRLTTEPGAWYLRGTYVLKTVEGVGLPADLSSGASGQLILLADTMQFDGIGGTVDLTTMSVVEISGSEPTVRQYSAPMRYNVLGSSVRFWISCRLDAD